ncbi:hypothetical protein HK405_007149, partial [Cladochytrium tenue]
MLPRGGGGSGGGSRRGRIASRSPSPQRPPPVSAATTSSYSTTFASPSSSPPLAAARWPAQGAASASWMLQPPRRPGNSSGTAQRWRAASPVPSSASASASSPAAAAAVAVSQALFGARALRASRLGRSRSRGGGSGSRSRSRSRRRFAPTYDDDDDDEDDDDDGDGGDSAEGGRGSGRAARTARPASQPAASVTTSVFAGSLRAANFLDDGPARPATAATSRSVTAFTGTHIAPAPPASGDSSTTLAPPPLPMPPPLPPTTSDPAAEPPPGSAAAATAARARWQEDKTYRMAFVAALFCCLFPLSAPQELAPATAPTSTASAATIGDHHRHGHNHHRNHHNQEPPLPTGSGEPPLPLSAAAEVAAPLRVGTWCYVRNGSLILGTKAFPALLDGLKRKADATIGTGSDDPRTRLFVLAVNKFFQQIPNFRLAEIANVETLILLFGALVTEEQREALPNPAIGPAPWQPRQDSAADDAILAQVDRFLTALRESVAAEPDAHIVLAHPLLLPAAAWDVPVRRLLAVFLDNPPRELVPPPGPGAATLDHLDAAVAPPPPSRSVTSASRSAASSSAASSSSSGFGDMRPVMRARLATRFGVVEAWDGQSRLSARAPAAAAAPATAAAAAAAAASATAGGLTMADWLAAVFEVDDETYGRAAAQVRAKCNDRVAFNELERYVEQLEASAVPAAPPADWDRVEAYEAWRDKELLVMTAFKLAYLARLPGLERLDEQTNLFLPPLASRIDFFRILVRQCLVYDLAHSSTGAVEASAYSRTVIVECAYRWQISKKARDVAFLEAVVNLYLEGKLGLEDMVSQLKKTSADSTRSIHHFRKSDKLAYLRVLRRVDIHMGRLLRNFTALLQEEAGVAQASLEQCVAVLNLLRDDRIWAEDAHDAPPDELEDTLIKHLK